MSYWASVDCGVCGTPKRTPSRPQNRGGGAPSGGLLSALTSASKRFLSAGGFDFSVGANWPDSQLRLLRSLSRQAVLVGTVGPAIVSARVNAAITGGLKRLGMSSGGVDDAFDREIQGWFDYYLDEPVSSDGLMYYDSACELALSTSLVDGDCFCVLSYSEERAERCGLGTTIDIVPGSLVCNPDDRPNSDTMISGCEFSPGGQLVKIHVLTKSANGQRSWRAIDVFSPGAFGYPVRVVYPLRCSGREVAGMVRGLPLFAPVLSQVYELDSFRSAFGVKARNEAAVNFVAKGLSSIQSSDGYSAPAVETVDLEGLGSADFRSFDLPSGATVYLPATGTELEAYKPGSALFDYEAASRPLANEIAAACEVSPEAVMRIFTTSYSGGTAGLNEVWRSRIPADRKRVARCLSQALFQGLADELVASGRVRSKNYASDRKARFSAAKSKWQGPARGSINYLTEYKARGYAEDRCWLLPEDNAAELFGMDFDSQSERTVSGATVQRKAAEARQPVNNNQKVVK